MWDWYNRPGRRALSTRAAVLVMVLGGVLVGAIMMVVYTLIAPLLFNRVGGP
jgi:hypothetical protein